MPPKKHPPNEVAEEDLDEIIRYVEKTNPLQDGVGVKPVGRNPGSGAINPDQAQPLYLLWGKCEKE